MIRDSTLNQRQGQGTMKIEKGKAEKQKSRQKEKNWEFNSWCR